MNTISVTFVLPDGISLGGVTTWSLEMAQRLPQQSQKTNVICHQTKTSSPLNISLSQATSVIDCTTLPHPENPNLDVASYLPAYKQILPSVVIPNWSRGTYAACALLSQQTADLRVIGYAHTDGPYYYQWLTYYEPIIHQFVAVSQEIAIRLAEQVPHRQADIVTRPYGVSLPPTQARAYSQTDEPLQLVYAGRISEHQKRVFDLIRLAEQLQQMAVNFNLCIVGDGVDRNSLCQQIEALPLATRDRVRYEGVYAPEQMSQLWQTADITVLVSDHEGTSITMLEAMAHGCVPIVTVVSGTRAVIQPQQNGFTVAVGDIARMAQIIKQLDSQRDLLVTYGQQAQATISQHYTVEQYTAWLKQLVDDVWQMPPRCWPSQRPLLMPWPTKGLCQKVRRHTLQVLHQFQAKFKR